MWNVSESTVKRWSDLGVLSCVRSPGGHRRFRLEDLIAFQRQRSFEATGLLATSEWEEPELEIWLNSRNFEKVRGLLLYLASQNQRSKVSALLDRAYLRGMTLDEIFEELVAPVPGLAGCGRQVEGMSEGHSLLVRMTIEEALVQLGPRLIRRRPNRKIALCGAAADGCRLPLTFMNRLLEVEGWEPLFLGDRVPFSTMSHMVENEPVSIVCLFCNGGSAMEFEGAELLDRTARRYRIPVVVAVPKGKAIGIRGIQPAERFDDLRSFRKYIRKLGGNS
jgi:hypothetical protein